MGFDKAARESSRYSEFVPPKVPFIPLRGRPAEMLSQDGRDYTARQIWVHGWDGFERPIPALYAVIASDRNHRVFVGVGANSGYYEILTASLSDSDQIFAFEPYPPAIEAFNANIELNSLAARVHLRRMAVAEFDGETSLYVPETDFGDVLESSSSLNSSFRESHSSVHQVETTRLDAFVAAEKLSAIDLLRVDVESAEHRVLAGAGQVLRSHRPFVFLEVLEQAEIAQMDQIVQEFEYVPFWFDANCAAVSSDRLAYHPENHNQVLCPREKKSQFAKYVVEAGLTLRDETV